VEKFVISNKFMWIIIAQRLLLDILLDIIYFPVWWYSGGIKFIVEKCYEIFKSGNARLAPGLWLKNIFVPMFGQWDWEGRIISFFMRLFQVVIRSIGLFFWLVFCLLIFGFWIIAPVIIFRGIF